MQKARRHRTSLLRPLVGTRFQVLFHSPSGVLFTFPSRYWSAIGHQGVLSLGGWSPQIRTTFHGCGATQEQARETIRFRLRGCYPLWRPCSTDLRLANDFVTPAQECSPGRPVLQPRLRNACTLARSRFRLFRFRSPLLAESRLISFPRGTEMFQFPRLPPHAYVFSVR